MPGIRKTSGKKLKVGTVLDEQIYQQLKERAVKEGRTISDVIQEAIVAYNANPVIDLEARRRAAKDFLTSPYKLTKEEIQEILDMDYYDQ
ncbi:MAG: hypothetical protein IT279_03230 [Ignavibacteriaceae bacterium]|nr:hypothetical protein [Ignavibacteriaceae bacterium]